jgi:hypothetical protein
LDSLLGTLTEKPDVDEQSTNEVEDTPSRAMFAK